MLFLRRRYLIAPIYEASIIYEKTKALIIFQKIVEKDRTAVKEYIDGKENAVWLARQVALEDEAAFGRIYEATGGLLFGLLLRALPDSRAAEVALESLYAEFRQEAARLDADYGQPFIWLIGIAVDDGQNIKHVLLNEQFEVLETSNKENDLPAKSG